MLEILDFVFRDNYGGKKNGQMTFPLKSVVLLAGIMIIWALFGSRKSGSRKMFSENVFFSPKFGGDLDNFDTPKSGSKKCNNRNKRSAK